MAGSTLASPCADPHSAAVPTVRHFSPRKEVWRRFRRHPMAVFSGAILSLIVLAVLLAPVIWRVPINDIDFSEHLAPPSWQHPFGTDDLGQDLLARMLYGGRISLAVGIAAMIVSTIVGTLIGAMAGMSRGWVGAGLMWLADLFLSLPQLPLLLMVIYLFRDALKSAFGVEGGVFILIVVVIGGLRWMPVARLVRAQFLSLREKEFVEAARALGATPTRQVVRHILPNALGPVIVAGTIDVAAAIIAESTHSLRRQRLLGHRSLLGDVSRRCHLPDGAVHQLHRRWAARRVRSATGNVMAEPLLEIRGLKTHFATDDGVVQAVDGVDLVIASGETVGVVGESGCGKSVTAMSVLKLIPIPPGRIVGGQVLWRGRDLLSLPAADMRRIRSKEIAIVFQEPMTSLNPVYTVGAQIAEVVRLHQGLGRRAALERTVELLRLVQIPNPERRVHDYPHQFSGGMRQRVMIAMALSCDPALLIADEPTTALDVTIQAQILELLQDMKARFGMAIMLITHAMGVVAETAQRVVVMYAGKVIEEAAVEQLFGNPRHPYTQGLIRSIPRLDMAAAGKVRLEAIPGVVPSLIDPPQGCRFLSRCPYAMAICRDASPPLREIEPGHKVACVL
jgi:peptide/nickel transport system ATP-binding protein